jgi:hypothetical protein
MAVGQQYCKQLRRHLTGLHANFPPNRALALGDFGVNRDDVFHRLGNIQQLGISFSVIDGAPTSNVLFKSEGAVDVEFIGKGEMTPAGAAARAGLDIRFSRKDAVFFNAAGCTMPQIDDVNAVGRALIERLHRGEWDSSFLVVTSLVRAARTTAIASTSSGSEVKLEATADTISNIDLADANLSLQIKRSRNTALEIVTASAQTPLMELSQVRGWLRDTFGPAALTAPSEAPPEPFVFVADEDPLEATLRIKDEGMLALEETVEAAAAVDEFRFEARVSSFDVDRAIRAYIPLLEACYAFANGRPVAFPIGYTPLGEIRADLAVMAEAVPGNSQEGLEAVMNDLDAVEASVIDPTAFGYVVLESLTGAILICIRGTQTPQEWLANFTAVPNTFSEAPEFGAVHLGFERMSRSVRMSIQQVLSGVPSDSRITVLGHSLGGAMATLTAVDLKRNFGRSRVDVCTVGGPRVGKSVFRRKFNAEIPECVRVTNQFDVVPHVPSVITGWNHVGEEIEVDGDLDSPHSLNAYLQGLRNIGRPRELVIEPSLSVPALEAAAPQLAVSIRVP